MSPSTPKPLWSREVPYKEGYYWFSRDLQTVDLCEIRYSSHGNKVILVHDKLYCVEAHNLPECTIFSQPIRQPPLPLTSP